MFKVNLKVLRGGNAVVCDKSASGPDRKVVGEVWQKLVDECESKISDNEIAIVTMIHPNGQTIAEIIHCQKESDSA